MKIVFMGSSSFAVASLSALQNTNHKIDLVVSQPDKPAGRGQKLSKCPVVEFADECGFKTAQPSKIKNNAEFLDQLKKINPDIIVVVAYGKILPKEILDLPKRGCINIHGSLLPKYRGAAPINWAIIKGETISGVTTMYMNEKMDEGDILLQCSTEIQPYDTAEMLHDHLAVLGADLLVATLDRIENGELKEGIRQNNDEATYAPILKKEDGLIDWSRGAEEIYNRIRGLLPWPKAYTHIVDKQFTIFDAAVIDVEVYKPAGTIISLDKGIMVATGDGQLCLLEVQIEGKKRLPAVEFVKGGKLRVGDIFA